MLLTPIFSCPVCYQNLDEVGGPAEQELHVKNCLEGGKGATPETAKYLVYRLPAESTLLGVECETSSCIRLLYMMLTIALQVSFVLKSL